MIKFGKTCRALRTRLAGGGALTALLCGTVAAAEPAKPDIVVTVKPVHSLVAAIAEGVASPHLLIEGAASPHTYAMKPSDVRRLNGADIVIRVSAQLEVFLAKPLAQLSPRTRVITVDKISGLKLLSLRGGADFEPHRHAGGDKPGKGHKSDRDHGHGHGEGAKGVDAHLWLDPSNARLVALHIATVLSEAVPAEASRFKRNADALAARIDDLDRQISTELAAVADRRFVTFHDAYQYLELRYRLAGAGTVTVNPEVPPSVQRISRLRARLAKDRIACVFAEPQFLPRVIETIIEGTGVRQATLDPLGAAIPSGPNQYIELMTNLARDLKGCLAPPA